MSVQQVEALIEFLEGHPEVALGRCSRSKEGRSLSKRLWQECADMLNSISADCAQKTGEQWRIFYNEYKHRLLKKIKKEKNERSATGGGPPIIINLTPLQEKLYTILGRDVGEPLPGVRRNPLSPIENVGNTSYHDGVDVVTDEVTHNNSGVFQPGPPGSRLFSECSNLIEIQDNSGIAQPGPSGSQVSNHIDVMEFLLEPNLEPRVGQQSEPISSQASREQTEPAGSQPQVPHTDQTAPRRRRRRRQRQQIPEPEDQELRSATAMLQALEENSAQATNRLAAAIEALVGRLNEPIRVKLEDPEPQQMAHLGRKRKIQIIDSDSE